MLKKNLIHNIKKDSFSDFILNCFKGVIKLYKFYISLLLSLKKEFLQKKIKNHNIKKTDWYKVVNERNSLIVLPDLLKQSIRKHHNQLHFKTILRPSEHVTFNIDVAIKEFNCNGICFVFFMGMGDYIYATPLIKELKNRYNSLPFYAYVSKNTDRNNSPLVAKLLENNLNIEKVFYYNGKADKFNWKNYDYQDVFKIAPKNFAVIPLIYEHSEYVRHRIYTLFETFSLPAPSKKILPSLDFIKNTNLVNIIINKIDRLSIELNSKGVVFLQLDARSSNYSYPFKDELANLLIEEGYIVVSVAEHNLIHNNLIKIDISKCSINESFLLTKLLKQKYDDKFVFVTVVSVFWAFSASIQVKNIGMQHFKDKCLSSVWYSNIYVVTNYEYIRIPLKNQYIVQEKDYSIDEMGFISYNPKFIINCLENLL